MTLTTTLSFIAASLGIAACASFALPRHVTIERSAVLPASPEAVLALAASNSGYQTFNPYLTRDPDLSIELFGPTSGIGSGFRFDGREGRGSQTVTEINTTAVVYSIDLGAMGQPQQSIHAVAVADGTEITWRVHSDMGFNPIFRVFGLFMDGMMGPTVEQGLENLRHASA
ncbi:MAG: SRPBCC family protein [Pseudomonadota bacterium]